MKKKIMALNLIFILLISLMACGNANTTIETSNENSEMTEDTSKTENNTKKESNTNVTDNSTKSTENKENNINNSDDKGYNEVVIVENSGKNDNTEQNLSQNDTNKVSDNNNSNNTEISNIKNSENLGNTVNTGNSMTNNEENTNNSSSSNTNIPPKSNIPKDDEIRNYVAATATTWGSYEIAFSGQWYKVDIHPYSTYTTSDGQTITGYYATDVLNYAIDYVNTQRQSKGKGNYIYNDFYQGYADKNAIDYSLLDDAAPYSHYGAECNYACAAGYTEICGSKGDWEYAVEKWYIDSGCEVYNNLYGGISVFVRIIFDDRGLPMISNYSFACVLTDPREIP